ncbi:MAG: hypothetical protein HFJ80_03435 [Clostridiales bacterium]|nr:hypothetical protein [Clostridiales bacterium]
MTNDMENRDTTSVCRDTLRLKQAMALLERIRFTAADHNMSNGGLFPCMDTYNALYDQAVRHGWITENGIISRIPKGLGTTASTRYADLERVGCMAALLLDMLSCLPEAEGLVPAPIRSKGNFCGPGMPDMDDLISDAVESAIEEAVSDAMDEVSDQVEAAVEAAIGNIQAKIAHMVQETISESLER